MEGNSLSVSGGEVPDVRATAAGSGLAEWSLPIHVLASLLLHRPSNTRSARPTSFIHPVAFAGWAGLLVTALNLIPAGTLDGGHVVYSLFGDKAARAFPVILVALLGLGLVWNGWWIWAVPAAVVGPRACRAAGSDHPAGSAEAGDRSPYHTDIHRDIQPGSFCDLQRSVTLGARLAATPRGAFSSCRRRRLPADRPAPGTPPPSSAQSPPGTDTDHLGPHTGLQ